jgi:5-methylcytosine-specific restriction endonuclease McrA
MQYVLVLDTNKQPLMPCHPARAKELLRKGKAAVYRRYPFTIILKRVVEDGQSLPVQVKIDPGSRVTGIVLTIKSPQKRWKVGWAIELHHRGQLIRDALFKRRQQRRSRRGRKTRYRAPRFHNRRRSKGWLPPSLQSRVDNTRTWVDRLSKLCPISEIVLERVKFDTQLLKNPSIVGIEYQQGELAGYEVREYLLEKWGRKCAYCGKTGLPLEIEHLIPQGRGGSHRVSNLTLACHKCNQDKGTQTATEFGYPHLMAEAQRPLKDAAAVNATRHALYRAFLETGIPVTTSTGGQTKYNRVQQNYPKAHWIDAACTGNSGDDVELDPHQTILQVTATGRGSRQMTLPDKHGFPRTKAKSVKAVHGFRTGDIVYARVLTGKKQGNYTGRVAIRKSGNFRVGKVDDIPWRYCTLLQYTDGYSYTKKKDHSSPPQAVGFPAQ